jgi:dTDP-4-dehydrorhamnose 3,5-epimerase-like enzyme
MSKTFKVDLSVKEPVLLKIQSISDDRGMLIPFTDDIDHAIFKRSYIVENYGKGVIRGLHYHKKEIKVFTMAAGAAKFVTFDLPPDMVDRNDAKEIAAHAKNNPGAVKTWVLSNRHHGVLVIPACFANGWISLEDHSVLVSLSSSRFEEAMNDDFRMDPMIVGEKYWQVIGR